MARRPHAIPKLAREAPVFYPTMEDMQRPFDDYVSSIEEEAWQYGIAVVQPPPGWSARPSGYRTLDDWLIQRPIRQYVTGSRGVFQSVHVEEKNVRLADFRRIANAEVNRKPSVARSEEDVECPLEIGVESQQEQRSGSCSGSASHSSRVTERCAKSSSCGVNSARTAIECGETSSMDGTKEDGGAGLGVGHVCNENHAVSSSGNGSGNGTRTSIGNSQRTPATKEPTGIGGSDILTAHTLINKQVRLKLGAGKQMPAIGNLEVTERGDTVGRGATGRGAEGGVATGEGGRSEPNAWWLCKEGSNEVDMALVERSFWKNVTHSPPLYGADGVGSFFDASVKEWNVGKLSSLLSRTLDGAGVSIPGVTTPYLYFGMWRALFAWHKEDMDLHSVNYLHFGAPKFWYVIPPAQSSRFQGLLQSCLASSQLKACPQFLRHKETLVSPQLLHRNGIPVLRVVQKPGQFVINLPGVYHCGFNMGFNCAESTNFATARWVPIGVKARACACQPDSVSIDMSLFLPPSLSPLPLSPVPHDSSSSSQLSSAATQCVPSNPGCSRSHQPLQPPSSQSHSQQPVPNRREAKSTKVRVADGKEKQRKRKGGAKTVPSKTTHAASCCSLTSSSCSVSIPIPVPMLVPSLEPKSGPVSSSPSTMTGWNTGITALQQLRCGPPPRLPPVAAAALPLSQQLPVQGSASAFSFTLATSPLACGIQGAVLALPHASVPAELSTHLRGGQWGQGEGEGIEEQRVRCSRAQWLQAAAEASEGWSNGGSSGSLSAVGGGKDMMGREICVVYERRCAVTSKKRKREGGARKTTQADKPRGFSLSVVREKKAERPKMEAGEEVQERLKRYVLLQRQERQERAERRKTSGACITVNGKGIEKLGTSQLIPSEQRETGSEGVSVDGALHSGVALRADEALGDGDVLIAGWDHKAASRSVVGREMWQFSERGTAGPLCGVADDGVSWATAHLAVKAAAIAAGAAVDVARAAAVLACTVFQAKPAVTCAAGVNTTGVDRCTGNSCPEGTRGDETKVPTLHAHVRNSAAGSVKQEVEGGADRVFTEEDASVCAAVGGTKGLQSLGTHQGEFGTHSMQGVGKFPRTGLKNIGSCRVRRKQAGVRRVNTGKGRKVKAKMVESSTSEMASSALHSAGDMWKHMVEDMVREERQVASNEDGIPTDGACFQEGRRLCGWKIREETMQAVEDSSVAVCMEELQVLLPSVEASCEGSGTLQCCRCRRMRQLPPHSHLPWHALAPAGAQTPGIKQESDEMSVHVAHQSEDVAAAKDGAAGDGAARHDGDRCGGVTEAEVGKRVCELLMQGFHCMWVEGLTCRMRRQISEEGVENEVGGAGSGVVKRFLWSNCVRDECIAALPIAQSKAKREFTVLIRKRQKEKTPLQCIGTGVSTTALAST